MFLVFLVLLLLAACIQSDNPCSCSFLYICRRFVTPELFHFSVPPTFHGAALILTSKMYNVYVDPVLFLPLLALTVCLWADHRSVYMEGVVHMRDTFQQVYLSALIVYIIVQCFNIFHSSVKSFVCVFLFIALQHSG